MPHGHRRSSCYTQLARVIQLLSQRACDRLGAAGLTLVLSPRCLLPGMATARGRETETGGRGKRKQGYRHVSSHPFCAPVFFFLFLFFLLNEK